MIKRIDGGIGWVTPERMAAADIAALTQQAMDAIGDLIRNPDVQVVVLVDFDAPQLLSSVDPQSADGIALATMCRSVTQLLWSTSKTFLIRQPSGRRSVSSFLSPTDSLSRRECQVLSLVSDGLTAQAIGDRLSISERTVESHVRTGYRKLGIKSRIDLIKRAAEFGL
ncbi:LuxR C-terminal-related transcriptional regulator [Kribbella sp. NPDC051587]|uniref:helix-turn-helix transcriptional regulator n=1 Tax=Kribbella sp. NPDC051587 TaxID=3364119 RepID=UPI0037B1C1B1